MQWITPHLNLLVVFAASASVSALILLVRRLYMPLVERRMDSRAVQAAHAHPTPRIGGLALLAGLVPTWLLLPDDISGFFLTLCVSLVPVVIAGLMEDLGLPVSPRRRLLAASASSALVILLVGMTIPRADLPGFDMLLRWAPFAALFTIFACAGLCNAFNLIDGLNGLSASVGLVCALGLAVIAAQAGQTSLALLNLMLIAGLTGFLSFNYPFGRIFLGDVGAYALGHLLAWCAIALMVSVEDLSAWAVLLLFFWPVADTFFAIYRRRRAGRPTDSPDRLHFHQLVMRAVEITMIGRGHRAIANPLATLIMTPVFTAPVVTGVWLWDRPAAAFLALCVYAALFVASYYLGMRFARRSRRSASQTGRISGLLKGSQA
ncbi:MAG: MraY family glycosyltransferase [Rhodobacterales bacterium]